MAARRSMHRVQDGHAVEAVVAANSGSSVELSGETRLHSKQFPVSAALSNGSDDQPKTSATTGYAD